MSDTTPGIDCDEHEQHEWGEGEGWGAPFLAGSGGDAWFVERTCVHCGEAETWPVVLGYTHDEYQRITARINRLEMEQLIERAAIQRVLEAWDGLDPIIRVMLEPRLVEALEGLRPGDEVTR